MEKAAIEYGDGLFELAEEEGAAEQIYEESRAMRRILLENPSYISLLNSRAERRKRRNACPLFSGQGSSLPVQFRPFDERSGILRLFDR